MNVSVSAEVVKTYFKTTKNNFDVCDFKLLIPTTIMVNKDKANPEFRKDKMDAFIIGKQAAEWAGFVGKVIIDGDLRNHCYQDKDNRWVTRAEIMIHKIYTVREYTNAE